MDLFRNGLMAPADKSKEGEKQFYKGFLDFQ